MPTTGVFPALGLEFVFTFFLMFVIQSVATDARASGNVAALAIGGTVALCALMGGPLSGASMNPARSLGPALLSGQLELQWVYVLAPCLGAVAGGWTYTLVACGPTENAARGCC